MAGELTDDLLDADLIERLLFECDGDITEVARRLHVRSDRVRRFVFASGGLRRVLDEIDDMAVDEARSVVYRALRDEASFQNRFYAAKVFLSSEAGKRRGFGRESAPHAAIEVKPGGGQTIILKWIDPDPVKVIEGEKT